MQEIYDRREGCNKEIDQLLCQEAARRTSRTEPHEMSGGRTSLAAILVSRGLEPDEALKVGRALADDAVGPVF